MMPIARFQMPDGRIARFEVPEGATPADLEAFAANLPQQPTPTPAAPTATPTGTGYIGPTTPAPMGPQGPGLVEAGKRGLLDFGQGNKQAIYAALEAAHVLPLGTTERYTQSVMPEREAYAAKREGITTPDFMRTAAAIAPSFLFPQGKIAGGLSRLAGAAGLAPGLAGALGQVGAGALGGGLAGATTFAEPGQSKLDQALMGAAVGGAMPAVAQAGRAVFGNTQSQTQRAMAEAARRANPPIPLTPKEEIGGMLTPRLEAGLNMTLGGSGAFKSLESRQVKALTANVAGFLGKRANEFTPEIRQSIEDDIGHLYEKALAGKALMPDQQRNEAFKELLREQLAKPKADQNKFLIEYITGTGNPASGKLDTVWTKPMDAQVYNKQRSKLGTLAVKRFTEDKTFDGHELQAVQKVLDDWADRRLPAESVPALQAARAKTRIWLTAQPAINAQTGEIDPSKFVSVLERDKGKDAVLEPMRNLASVAFNIRTRPFSPIGVGIGTGVTSLLGGLAGMGTGAGPIMGTMAGAALPYAASQMYLNPMLQKLVSKPAQGLEQVLLRGAAPVTSLFGQ